MDDFVLLHRGLPGSGNPIMWHKMIIIHKFIQAQAS